MTHLHITIILSQVTSGTQLLIPLVINPTCEPITCSFQGWITCFKFHQGRFLLSLQKGSVSPNLYEDNCRALMGHFSFSETCFAWSGDFPSWNKTSWSSGHKDTLAATVEVECTVTGFMVFTIELLWRKDQPVAKTGACLAHPSPLQAAGSQRNGLKDDYHKGNYLTADHFCIF